MTREEAINFLESCDDCISRQAVLEAFWNLDVELRPSAINAITDMIKSMPSVTPQPKMEKWKIGQWKWEPYDRNSKFGDIKLGDWHCSECGSVVSECVYKDEKRGIPFYKYCPQCGAKMREVNADADSD